MTLNIIEPTLNSYTGHCYSLVESIAQAAPVDDVRVWAGIKSGSFWKARGQIHPYFHRAIRKIQSYFLFKRLLKEPGEILVSTAGTADLLILDMAANGQIPQKKVFLYFHWLGAKASRAKKLAKLAKKQPNLVVLCATESTTQFFKELGFQATTVAYPVALDSSTAVQSSSFTHLLFAGAARMDKGFDRIADLVDDLAAAQADLPIWVQASTTHQAKHSAEIQFQIDRLKISQYAPLTLLDETLPPQSYRALFLGAISIQPYSKSEFEDRVSGVTLDALSAGCPVVVTENTWLGRMVLQHGAGIATNDLSAAGLRRAIDEVLGDYQGFSHRAALAGRALQQEHSATSMMRAIYAPKLTG